jgi:DNA polymerase-1
MRVIYIADEGYTLISADYSQIELWVAAILAGGKQMLRDLQDGIDVHNTMCQLCYPDVPIKYNKKKKDFTYSQVMAAKAVVFGTVFGRSPRSIAIEFSIPTSVAESWQLACVNKYPEIDDYRHRCEKAFRTTGRLETPFGRRRTLRTLTQGFNFPVQSTASDITLSAIVEADQAGLWVWNTIHDEIVFQVLIKKRKEQLELIKKIMEREVPELENLSFKASYAEGINWFEMKSL